MIISKSKTKILANPRGLSLHDYAIGEFIYLGNFFSFEVVSDFKYLGLQFNAVASDKHMIQSLLTKARCNFGWLNSFVITNGWTHPHIRLVLLDVYTRAIL